VFLGGPALREIAVTGRGSGQNISWSGRVDNVDLCCADFTLKSALMILHVAALGNVPLSSSILWTANKCRFGSIGLFLGYTVV
jgi:hypothetical protein